MTTLLAFLFALALLTEIRARAGAGHPRKKGGAI